MCINHPMNIVSVRDLSVCIKQARKNCGWTQAELAEKSGVSRDWIIGLESAKSSVELGLVLRTLKALNLPLSIDLCRDHGKSVEGIDLDDVLNQPSRDDLSP